MIKMFISSPIIRLLYLIVIICASVRVSDWILKNYIKTEYDVYVHQDNKTYYAILASTPNFIYFFPLPLTILIWRTLNVDLIVMLIGNRTFYEADPKLNYVLRFLESNKVKTYFVQNHKLTDFTLAQIIRLFAASMPFTQSMDLDNNVFITTDADMFTFRLWSHAPNYTNQEVVKLYYSNCCGSLTIKGRKVRHIPLNSIAMSIRLWREVMDLGNDPNFDGEKIESYMFDIFGEEFMLKKPSRGNEQWYTDQRLISYKIDEWARKTPNRHKLIGEYARKPIRIDRINWPKSFNNINLKNYDDSHIPHGVHEDSKWQQIVPLLKKVFEDDHETLKSIFEYKEGLKGLENKS